MFVNLSLCSAHRVPIEWDVKRQIWSLGPTVDRQYVHVNNASYPLREVPAKSIDPSKFDKFVDRMSPEAIVPEVYVVEKIKGMRVKAGEVEYRVKWKGWGSKDNTWEPKAHLVDFGSHEAVAEWHADNPDRPDPDGIANAIMHVQQLDDDYQAVESLIRKHKLEGTVDDWMPGYTDELNTVMKKRMREIHGSEYEDVMKNEKVVRLRMNPEPKKGGRKKCRLLVRGDLEPKEWDGKTDSPTALASTVKMLRGTMGMAVPCVRNGVGGGKWEGGGN